MANLIVVFVGVPLFVLWLAYQIAGEMGLVVVAVLVAVYFWSRYVEKVNRKAAADREQQRRTREEEYRREEAKIERERVEAEAQAREQKRLGEVIVDSRSTATKFYNSIPRSLVGAETFLDQADHEFVSGAFAPFWDAVESALRALGEVNSSVKQISVLSSRHTEAANELRGGPPPFPVSSQDIAAFDKPTAFVRERLASIVRKAQTDFHFSSIYEQRKTNSILIEGFQTLSDAMTKMGNRLADAISDVASQLSQMEDGQRSRHVEMLDSNEAIRNAINDLETSQLATGEMVVSAHRSIAEAAKEQRYLIAEKQSEAADRQLAMLDNMQRHRKPLISEKGPRQLI